MDRLIELLPELWDATLETLYVASGALILGGLGGLVLGIALYATRAGSLFPNRVVFGTLNVIVNTFRPIPFIILLLALQPVARGLGLPVPGPVIGLLLLVASCSLRPRLAEMLRPVTLGLLGNLSLFFVPAGVGVVAHLGEFRSDGLAIALALTVSTALAIAVAALVFVWVVRATGGQGE